MSTSKIVLVGGALGLVAYALVKYFSQDFSIDPSTGAVALPAGDAFGPAVPDAAGDAVVPGPIVEGLN